MFWGFTPCLDLVSEYEKRFTECPEELNIFIAGGSDARHVLQTVAKRYRHKKVRLNFYILEACMEVIARHLLLLYIATQPSEELGLIEKTSLFMELYGNAFIRPSAAAYLADVAQEFVKFVTLDDYLPKFMPFLKLGLRYKERDYLENLFLFWRSDEEFNIRESWEHRMRRYLGVRFDNKMGAFDWDLHMRLHAVGGGHVSSQEYQNFRLNGVGFTWLESDVSKTNRSLACAVIPNGEKFAHHGYLGDMITGPFVSYGMETEDPDFLKKVNGVFNHRATDVAERNLKQIFHELEHQAEYEHQPVSDVQPGSIVKVCEPHVVDSTGGGSDSKREFRKCFDLEDVVVTFVSVYDMELFEHKGSWRGKFDMVYYGNNHLKYLRKNALEKVTKEKSLAIVENKKFMLGYRDDDLVDYESDINEKMMHCVFEREPFDVHKDNYMFYVHPKQK